MEESFRDINEENLLTHINTLRDVLNEICCTIDEHEPSLEKLILSRQLDELIVEYMNLKDKYEDKTKGISH